MSLGYLVSSIPGGKGYYRNASLSRYEWRKRTSKGSDEIVLVVLLAIRTGPKEVTANHDFLWLAVQPK